MARNTLPLQAYLIYARGSSGHKASPLTRPKGPVIYAHGESREQAQALTHLCCRLQHHRPELNIYHSQSSTYHHHLPLPQDRTADCDALAQRLRPDVLLWAGQSLRPALLSSLARAGTRLVMVEAHDAPWQSPAPRWMPDPSPATLELFDSIYTVNRAAARRLRRLGVGNGRLRRGSTLIDSDSPLPCDDATYEEVQQMLVGRPVWLAAHLRGSEARAVLQAHRQAVRLAHRLLLIAVPENEDEAEEISAAAQDSQLRLCNWDLGETLDENSQVLLTEGPEELGLWYRCAPLAYLGGSLVPGYGGHDPFEAATQGTALLYGPNVGLHLNRYSQLVEAGGARIVRDGDSLASAVSALLAPDQAAAMAHAGWDVISSGAELIDTVMQEVFDHLDTLGTATQDMH